MSLSLAQLSATIFRKEGLEAWPQLMQLLQHSTHSPHIPEREVLAHAGWVGGREGEREGLRGWVDHTSFSLSSPTPGQMGLLLLSVVVSSRPEAFQPHHRELLRLLNETLGEVGSPGLLFYSLRTLTTVAPYLGTDDVVRCGSSPSLAPCPRAFHILALADAELLRALSLPFVIPNSWGYCGWLDLGSSCGQALRKLPASGA